MDNMEYQYFNAGPQPYPFLGLPPTPSHTTSGASDGFSNGSPEQDFDQFQTYDNFGFNHAVPNPASPPTPLTHDANSKGVIGDFPFDAAQDSNNATRAQSHSDEEQTAEPVNRRKAQNRAAQRAFRERKEKHVKDLEAKIADMEKASQSINEENERLKRDLQRVATENEILKATSAHHQQQAARASSQEVISPTTGPMQYSPTDFYSDLLDGHANKTPSHRIVHSSETGERLLAAGATWDFIIAHPLYKSGLVDVGAVGERLRTLARCDGQGPVFQEKDIVNAIEKSIASGNDELL